MAYVTPEQPPQGARLIAAYDTPRHSLLDRGISLRAAPDMTGFRQYLAARQRAEEIGQAEAAIAKGVKPGRRRLFGGQPVEDVPDPQLRPVTWAVARRPRRPALRSDEAVGPFDIEDAHMHRGLEAHAFVVNADSTSAAVCGFRPRSKKVPGGGRLAELAAASFETNRKCPECLVLLYQTAITGQTETGPWPAADATHAEAEAAAQTEAQAAHTEAQAAQAEAEAAPIEADVLLGDAGTAEGEIGEAVSVRAQGYVEVPIEPDDEIEEVAEAETSPAGEAHVGGEDYSLTDGYSLSDEYGEPEPAHEREEALEAAAVAESAVEYAEPREPDALEAEVGEEATQPVEDMRADSGETTVIPIFEDWDAEHEAIEVAAAEVEVHEAQVGAPQLVLLEGTDPLDAVVAHGVEDVLVVAAEGRTAIIVGGVGRGADWAGSMLDMEDEPTLRRAWSSNHVLHRDDAEPQRICGPYWARAAVLVPVGEATCVIFGSPAPIELPEQMLHDAAGVAAERFDTPSMEAALADEREVSIALSRIMAGSELSFEGALDHVLSTTASVLGSSIAAGVVRMGRRLAMRAIDLDGTDSLDPAMLLGGAPLLAGEQGVSIEESASGDLSLSPVVSRLRIPLSGSNVEGLLVVTHTARRPRGFTTHDHRMAESIAPAAVLVLERAGFGEGLQVLESHIRSAPATDPLTGLANKAAWDQALASEGDRIARSGGSAAVAAFRIEGLKRIDDRQGPLARDAALREAAELVRNLSRSTDLAARVGDDEFRVLVRGGGTTGARRLAVRIRRAARHAQAQDSALPPLAVSWASAQSRPQLMAAGRLIGQRLRARARATEGPRIGSGRAH